MSKITKLIEYCHQQGIPIPKPIPVENGEYTYLFDLATIDNIQWIEINKILDEDGK